MAKKKAELKEYVGRARVTHDVYVTVKAASPEDAQAVFDSGVFEEDASTAELIDWTSKQAFVLNE